MNVMASFPVLLFLAAVLHSSFAAHGNKKQDSASLSTDLSNLQREILNEYSELRKTGSLTANNLPQMKWSGVKVAKESNWGNQKNYKHSHPEYRKKKQECPFEDKLKNCNVWRLIRPCPRRYAVLCKRTCFCVL